MATVRINGHGTDEETPTVWVSEDEPCVFPIHGKTRNIGRYTNPVRITIDIALDEDYDGLTIFGEFQGGHHSKEISKAGIWIGVTDQPTFRRANVEGQDNSQFFGINPEESQSGVDIRQWKFGNKPELRIMANEGNQSFRAFIFAAPFFEEDKLQGTVELILKFMPENEHGKIKSREFDRTIRFIIDRERSTPLDIQATHSSLGAFQNEGAGFSVHPKQLHTAHGVGRAVRKIKEERDNEPFAKDVLSVAYIGPDTTENLRTIFRALESENVHYTVLQKPEWDWSTSRFPHQGGEHSISCLKNVEIVDISQGLDDLNRDNNEYYDIVISTYIGYWALSDDANEKIYRNLLTTLIDKKKTKLITVDARDPKWCVLARPPNHIGWENLYKFYESLEMKENPMFWNQKDNTNSDGQIACFMWTGGS